MNEADGKYTVLVAGDLILDNNIAQCVGTPTYHNEVSPRSILKLRPGGAWYLADLIERACSDLQSEGSLVLHKPDDPETLGNDNGQGVSRAYQTWKLCERVKGDKDHKVWRIDKFLGCQPSENATRGESRLVKLPRTPDLLVIDDAGLGFSSLDGPWSRLLAKCDPRGVILRTSLPPDRGPFWTTLLTDHADKLTVILSADTLRSRGAAISKASSWDCTLEGISKEFGAGLSRRDLGKCRRTVVLFSDTGLASFSRCLAASPGVGRNDLRKESVLERFLYQPDELECSWRSRHPGQTFGATSILTSALVRHELRPGDYPLFTALSRGLTAVQVNHLEGGGSKDLDPDVAHSELAKVFHPPAKEKDRQEHSPSFFAAFPKDWLRKREGQQYDTLLDVVTGLGPEYVGAKAFEVVVTGAKNALAAVPKARYGKYLTVDREEIESINAVRSLILSYLDNPADKRPVSIAVFGPPGSGKSYAIKRLAGELFRNSKPIEYNLSEFQTPEQLHSAFHCVRDASVQGEVPLVFWDEFDADDLTWLKHFLAPMQDACFRENGLIHPFGKAIFVFAGGTRKSFEEFDRSADPCDKEFIRLKGPDFVSRLRGHVNIKGPNRVGTGVCAETPSPKESGSKAAGPVNASEGDTDRAYVIRRALLLRSFLDNYCGQIIDPKSELASIRPGLVRAFLLAERYLHGARSMEAIVSMSSVGDSKTFGPSHLPCRDYVLQHVTPDFYKWMEEAEIDFGLMEELAEACHTAWCNEKMRQGYEYGPKRKDADDEDTYPEIRPADLSDADKLRGAIATARAGSAGAWVRGALSGAESASVESLVDGLNSIVRGEDLWKEIGSMKVKLSSHTRFLVEREELPEALIPVRNRKLLEDIFPGTITGSPRRHRLIKDYRDLEPSDQENNRKTARLTRAKLREIGFEIESDGTDKALDAAQALQGKIDDLKEIEHDIWLRDYMVQGYEYADKTNDKLKLHRDAVRFGDVPPGDQVLDDAIVQSIPKVLKDNGYVLIKSASASDVSTADQPRLKKEGSK